MPRIHLVLTKEMGKTRSVWLITLAATSALVPRLAAQLQTEVPPLVSGAKPVSVARIKIHGASLEGNLEGNPVDRDVLVCFCHPAMPKKNLDDTQLSMRFTAIPSVPSNGPAKYICRKP